MALHGVHALAVCEAESVVGPRVILAVLHNLQVMYFWTSSSLCHPRQPRATKNIMEVSGPLRFDARPLSDSRNVRVASLSDCSATTRTLHQAILSSRDVVHLVLQRLLCHQHSFLRFLLLAVKVTEDGFTRVSPLEAPVQVRDTLNQRLRYHVMMIDQYFFRAT